MTAKSARPAPPPQTKIAERLERVREHAGVSSLRAFHARLADGWTEEDGLVSYEAVRNYHYDREPPVAYVRRVAEVFGVRLAFLISGEEPMTVAEGRLSQEDGDDPPPDYRDLIRDAVPNLAELEPRVEISFFALILRTALAHQRTGLSLEDEEIGEMAKWYWRLITAPFLRWEALLGRHIPVDRHAFSDYAAAVIQGFTFCVHMTLPLGISPEEIEQWPEKEENDG